MNIYIVCEINLWPFTVGNDFVIGSLFEASKLTNNPDLDNYKYSEYGIGFNALEAFRCLLVLN